MITRIRREWRCLLDSPPGKRFQRRYRRTRDRRTRLYEGKEHEGPRILRIVLALVLLVIGCFMVLFRGERRDLCIGVAHGCADPRPDRGPRLVRMDQDEGGDRAIAAICQGDRRDARPLVRGAHELCHHAVIAGWPGEPAFRPPVSGAAGPRLLDATPTSIRMSTIRRMVPRGMVFLCVYRRTANSVVLSAAYHRSVAAAKYGVFPVTGQVPGSFCGKALTRRQRPWRLNPARNSARAAFSPAPASGTR